MIKLKSILSIIGASLAFLFLFQNCRGGNFQVSELSEGVSLPSLGVPSQNQAMRSSLVKNSFTMPFSGNGHNTTWDGRLVIYTTGNSWEATVFRPEKVQAEQGVAVNLGAMDGSGAFSQNMGLLTLFQESQDGSFKDFSKDSLGNKSFFYQFNALTLAPASGVPGVSNPFKSDDQGNPSNSGSYETYDLYIYTQNYFRDWGKPNSQVLNLINMFGERVFGRLQMKVIVQNAKTGNAIPVRTILVKDFEIIKTSSGSPINGIEPSVTTDGKLMIFNSNGLGGNGDEIKYIYNSNPASLAGWTTPKNISYLNSENDSFKAQYALARKPILAANGQPYSPGESILGAYPWISWEGSEITFMAAHAHHPTAAARRTGFSVLGRWTGNKVRHIDGSFNKDTKGTKTIRLFTSALGSTSSIWNPFKEVKNANLPFLFESPSFFMISSNTAEFSELGFHDFVDGRYEISLPMNPMLKKVTNSGAINDEFDFDLTADLSQNHLNGELASGASFPLENSNGIIDSVNQIGFRGQAIQFPESGSVKVNDHAALTETSFGSTYEIFVKPIVDLSAAASNSFLFLIHKPGTLSLVLEKNRQLNARIWINGKEFSTGLVGTALELNQWTHVAVTHDPVVGSFKVFSNGQKIGDIKIDVGVAAKSTSKLILGPGGQNVVNQSGFLLHLDEFKYSSVARSSVEIANSAAIPFAQRNSSSLASLLPSAFTTKDARLPSEMSLSADKVQLGFLLFNDQRLSVNNKISCASCHSASNAFADPVDFSTGVLGTKLTRHSPVVFNRLFGSTQMWDGRFSSLEQQSSGPVTHPSEMGMATYQALVDKLKSNSSYVKAFQKVYSSEIKPEYVENALAAFQLSLVTQKSKYDSYFTEGQIAALSLDEKKGKDLFFGKAKCAACHSGPNFTDEIYHNTGLFPTESDKGRGDITHRSSDHRFYKTPTLRNLINSAPYMHNGSLPNLEAVVQLYNAGGLADPLRDSEIKPLNLTSEEANQLVLFLKTLTSNIEPIISFNTSLKNVEDVYPVATTCDPATKPSASDKVACQAPNQSQLLATQNYTVSCESGAWVRTASGAVNYGSCPVVVTCDPATKPSASDKVACQAPNQSQLLATQNYTVSCDSGAWVRTASGAVNYGSCPVVTNDFIVENNKSLKPGEYWGNSVLRLFFQNDGNFVLYKNGTQVLWKSDTQKSCPTATSCSAALQADGNLVLYDGMTAYWNTRTDGQGSLRLKITETSPYVQLINSVNSSVWSSIGFKIDSNDFVVENSSVLKPGEFWGNSVLRLFFQNDGNFVLYKNGTQVLWKSDTFRSCPLATSCQAVLQSDGNLVLYSGTTAFWNSETWGKGALKLKVSETSPYLQLVNANGAVLWSGQ